jgi:hypothetical protein
MKLGGVVVLHSGKGKYPWVGSSRIQTPDLLLSLKKLDYLC